MNALAQDIMVGVNGNQQSPFSLGRRAVDCGEFETRVNWEGIAVTFGVSAAGWAMVAAAVNFFLS